jgi:hypothetical protein
MGGHQFLVPGFPDPEEIVSLSAKVNVDQDADNSSEQVPSKAPKPSYSTSSHGSLSTGTRTRRVINTHCNLQPVTTWKTGHYGPDLVVILVKNIHPLLRTSFNYRTNKHKRAGVKLALKGRITIY